MKKRTEASTEVAGVSARDQVFRLGVSFAAVMPPCFVRRTRLSSVGSATGGFMELIFLLGDM